MADLTPEDYERAAWLAEWNSIRARTRAARAVSEETRRSESSVADGDAALAAKLRAKAAEPTGPDIAKLLREDEARRSRQFPIQGANPIPWLVIAPFDARCQRNHSSQDLERIAQRGGLDASEAIAVLMDADYDEFWIGKRSAMSRADKVLMLTGLVNERIHRQPEAPPQGQQETR